MYSIQHLEARAKSADPNLRRMYSMNYASEIENTTLNMDRPKSENIFRSTFNAALNMFGEQFSRVFNSLASNANNTLSVTVVQNEGIISPEFFKSLTMRRDMSTANDCIYNKRNKEILDLTESLPNVKYYRRSSVSGGSDKKEKLNSKSINLLDSDYHIQEHKKPLVSMHCDMSLENSKVIEDCPAELVEKVNSDEKNCKAKFFDEITNPMTVHKMLSKNQGSLETVVPKVENIMAESNEFSKNCKKCESNEILHRDEEERNREENSVNIPMYIRKGEPVHISPTLKTVTQGKNSRRSIVSDSLKNTWQRIVNGECNSFGAEAEIPALEVPAKRSHSQKKRGKLNTVAKGRGRGRAKSQLRRSGVSQNTYRKERIKRAVFIDMQDDYETWQDFELYHPVRSESSLVNYELDAIGFEITDDAELTTGETVSSVSFKISDIKPRKHEPKLQPLEPTSVVPLRHVDRILETDKDISDYDGWYIANKDNLRQRLLSESSVDSDDSYCIVFETESEINCMSDFSGDETTDEDQDSEDDAILRTAVQKVKFNLKPTIHTMIQWDYAYRAARKGPWEEMARDRGRFRGRINCVERVLSPILTMQHRFHIWQERFAPNAIDEN